MKIKQIYVECGHWTVPITCHSILCLSYYYSFFLNFSFRGREGLLYTLKFFFLITVCFVVNVLGFTVMSLQWNSVALRDETIFYSNKIISKYDLIVIIKILIFTISFLPECCVLSYPRRHFCKPGEFSMKHVVLKDFTL